MIIHSTNAIAVLINTPKLVIKLVNNIFYKHYPSLIAGTMKVSEMAGVCELSRPTVYKYMKLLP